MGRGVRTNRLILILILFAILICNWLKKRLLFKILKQLFTNLLDVYFGSENVAWHLGLWKNPSAGSCKCERVIVTKIIFLYRIKIGPVSLISIGLNHIWMDIARLSWLGNLILFCLKTRIFYIFTLCNVRYFYIIMYYSYGRYKSVQLKAINLLLQ